MNARMLMVPTLALALVAGACKGKDSGNGTLAADSALSRDLAMANKDSAVQPQLKDVPAPAPAPVTPGPVAPRTTPRPRATTPAPLPVTPPAPAPRTTASGNTVEKGTRGSEGSLGSIAAGTSIALASNDRVCTNTFKPGDRFTANVTETVTGSNGAMIPAGAKAVLQVTSVKRSENSNDKGEIGLQVVNVTMNGTAYPLQASVASAGLEAVRSSTTGDDAKKVIGGAVIGAIAGQILGKNTKSTVIGAAAGAAVGAGAAAATGNFDFCIPSGGRIVIKLDAPASIRAN
ncbi:MAG: hypothetical protein ABJD07_07145 [Gemmatimonadaceae bacterium]